MTPASSAPLFPAPLSLDLRHFEGNKNLTFPSPKVKVFYKNNRKLYVTQKSKFLPQQTNSTSSL